MPDRPSSAIESHIPFDFVGENLAKRLQRPPLGERMEGAIYRGADNVERFFDRKVSMSAMIDGVRRFLGRIRKRR